MRYTPLRVAGARLFLGLAALSSAGWAVLFLFHSDQSVRLDAVANRIMSGDAFQQKPLAEFSLLVANAESRAFCNPLEARATAIIRLRQFEDAVNSSDTKLADQRLEALRSSVDLALGCVPTEGFLWFIRYWSAIHKGGVASDHFDDLRMSYLLSPFEGWIALRRSPYALAIYDILPSDLKEKARDEFVAIVASAFIPDSVKILQGSGWAFRNELLPSLVKIRLDIRIQLDKRLRAAGLSIVIPGVEPTEFRPWQ